MFGFWFGGRCCTSFGRIYKKFFGSVLSSPIEFPKEVWNAFDVTLMGWSALQGLGRGLTEVCRRRLLVSSSWSLLAKRLLVPPVRTNDGKLQELFDKSKF